MEIKVVVEHCPLSIIAVTIFIRVAVTTAKDLQDQAPSHSLIEEGGEV